MGAAIAGNVPLVETLLDLGVNPELTDHMGYNALHWAMRKAFHVPKYARSVFAAIYEQIAQADIDVKVGERLGRIDRHLSEYFLFQTLWVLCHNCFRAKNWRDVAAFDTSMILNA